MTVFNYNGYQKDLDLINDSYEHIGNIIFGTKAEEQKKALTALFYKEVSEVNVHPQGRITPYLNQHTSGVCRPNTQTGKTIIDFYGYIGARPSQYAYIKHTAAHEFCHMYTYFVQKALNKHPYGIKVNGMLYEYQKRYVKVTNIQTGEVVAAYGLMRDETMMDIITSMSNVAFDPNTDKNVDDILKHSYDKWGSATTGYSLFTSITRLFIAAFSNNGSVKYQQIVNNGDSIFNAKTKMSDNKTVRYVNDYLYGTVFDPLHIDMEYDKFMGVGKYGEISEKLDLALHKAQKGTMISKNLIKEVMNDLADFLNRRMDYYISNKILTTEDANKIIDNFNEIWNNMQIEYSTYFTIDELKAIARRNGK